jgi:hypothetical protein
MRNRLLMLAVVTIGVVAIGLAPSPGAGGIAGVQVGQAQVEDPADDTILGGLDETDLGEPVDETDLPGAPVTGTNTGGSAAPPPDPDAGLDDTPAGGLDGTDLGEPLDETDHPAVDNPAPVTPTSGGTFPQVIYVPVPTAGAPNKASGKRKSAAKKRKLTCKRKLAHKRKVSRKRRLACKRKLAHEHRRRSADRHTRR